MLQNCNLHTFSFGISIMKKYLAMPKNAFRLVVHGALLSLCLLLASCSRPDPVRVGFVDGLSGKFSDLGTSNRNGVIMAVEQRNSAGGLAGRPIELIVRDSGQEPEKARHAVRELIALEVDVIIGPGTSNLTLATADLANEAKIVMISPTTTARELSGRYEHFFRVVNTTREYASQNALFRRFKLKENTIAAVYDVHNQAYSQSWLKEFRKVFEESGGRITAEIPFESGSDVHFMELARKLVASRADGILIIANSVDAALLCQLIRRLDHRINIGAAEWASTEQLIELGGKAVEGVYLAQFFNRSSTQPEYVAFRKNYIERFGREPGFGGIASYDAANVALYALEKRKPSESLRDTILAIREFKGLQEPIVFTPGGEAARKTFITTVRDGTFRNLEQ